MYIQFTHGNSNTQRLQNIIYLNKTKSDPNQTLPLPKENASVLQQA